jgi:hypothetical protein
MIVFNGNLVEQRIRGIKPFDSNRGLGAIRLDGDFTIIL